MSADPHDGAIEAAAREVEQAVLPDPDPDQGKVSDPVPTNAAFRSRLRRARIKADPRTAEQKAARAAQDRDVWVQPGENAMAHLGAALPAEGAATVMAAVHAKADQLKTPGDPRTKAQRRADGLVQICAGYLNGDTHSDTCKIKTTVAAPPASAHARARSKTTTVRAPMLPHARARSKATRPVRARATGPRPTFNPRDEAPDLEGASPDTAAGPDSDPPPF